ncbi:MAG TPA: glycosyltransferase [Longimicrobiales bacterium]|nr:glycosyltransferase [Longimicrobiales bacterium]
MTDVPLGSVEVDPAIPVPIADADAERALVERASTLRVALVSDAIPGRNGVGTYYDDLAANLRDHVEGVALFAPPQAPDPDYAGLEVPMPGDPTQKLYLPSPARLHDDLRRFRPDVVVAATPWLYGVLSIFMARRIGAGVCIGYHTQIDRLLEMYWERFGMGSAAQRVVAMWDRLLFRFGDVVLVHNERLIEAARTGGARRVSLVGTPVPRAFLDAPLPELPTTIETIVFVGRLAPEKELGQILEAAERHADVDFVLAGDGPLRSEVDARSRELANVDVLGWVDRDEVRRRIDGADAIVLPSRYETFGSAAFEAMIRGRPAIVSRNCGLTRWSTLQPGIVVMKEDERLADTLERVRALGPAKVEALARRAREGSRALSDRTVEHWLAVLTRTADQAR